MLGECRTMPTNFTRDVIMKAPSHDIMNSMARSVLTLASYDPKAADLDISNVLRQSIQLAGIFPMLAVYSYHAYNHYEKDGSMYIHRPDPSLSTAENFLRMLRPDMQYTELEARVLDVALLLHAEHGGGNNSTFTTRVVTSSGTDTYSAMAAALCSLKGPRHGGANLMVMHMMQNIRDNLHDIEDDEELEAYLKKLLHGEAFDRKGLIYGMGHAVYSLSDPREVVFKGYVEQLAHEKGRDKDLSLYTRIERMAPQLIAEERKIFKGVSPNVDFTAALCTICWASPWSCTPRCLPWPASWAGAPTASRSCSAPTRSSARPTRAGTVNIHARIPQDAQGLLVGVAVLIVDPAGDDAHFGQDSVQEDVAGGGAGTVVAHLQHIGPEVRAAVHKVGLRSRFHVAGEQKAGGAVVHPQDDGGIVGVVILRHRAQHGHSGTAQRPDCARSGHFHPAVGCT